jgi:carboxylate-amine ligase
MAAPEPQFTVGIEEEYLLVDRDSRDLATEPPEAMMTDCEALLRGQVCAEFLRSQIEVGTRVCETVAEARADLSYLRGTVAEIAEKYGYAPIAASTHPFADWDKQRHTDKDRYNMLADDLQGVARRLLIGGMHVHVGIEDDELRIDLMNQVSYFLPHLLALSTSSPFWRGDNTGLMSYRICVFDELPRTGLPDRFTSYKEYTRLVAIMVEAGLLEDATKLWWDVRPSARFPTLEMRLTDVCTYLDDAACVAALYQCVLRMLYRLRLTNQRWRSYPRMLIDENRWRAQRYGVDGGLVDFGKGEIVPYPQLMEELLELVAEDALALKCESEIGRARAIVAEGTSAHRQVKAYDDVLAAGGDEEGALKAVVDLLVEETTKDI